MKTEKAILKLEEQAVFDLRALYSRYGYLPYKMSRFEEYDLYVRNKDFLASEQIVTFADRNGKLLALKPDVTLSIIKNAPDIAGAVQKLYYNESVYRHNCRPKAILLTFADATSEYIVLEDTYDEQTITFDQYYYTNFVKLTIKDVYTGTKYQDTVIAELDFTAYRP